MAHSVVIQRGANFMAFGNTTAEILTDGLPPEENADILSIACGDPRHILYTVYADHFADDREFDITCCDMEPAVLARNVLLLTLIIDTDKETNETIWDIFYHFRVSESTSTLLHRHCVKLLAASETAVKWIDSPYSQFIQPRTKHTLFGMRQFWSKYAQAAAATAAQRQRMQATVAETLARNYPDAGGVASSMRSAGVFWPVMLAHGLSVGLYSHYWKHGVVAGTAIADNNLINPTFYFTSSGSGFRLHDNSDPVLGFHLAGICGTVENPAGITMDDTGAYAKREFGDWCNAFRQRLRASGHARFVMRPFAGDATSFCRALNGEANQTVSSWDGRSIALDDIAYRADSAAPPTFNVIDTSNVVDHIGLYNVLTVAIPLLRQTPSSVLYTDYMHAGLTKPALLESVGVDLTTLCLLLGLSPVSLTSRFATKAPPSFALPVFDGPNKQFQQAVAWKYSSSGDRAALRSDGTFPWQPVAVDPEPLCNFLFKVYYKMFAVEDRSYTEPLSPAALADAYRIREIRASYAAFRRLVKNRITTDWIRAMQLLFEKIGDDRFLFPGFAYYHDLCTQVHLLGVYSRGYLTPPSSYPIAPVPDILADWRTTPLVVYVVWSVPYRIFKAIKELPMVDLGSPMLQCEFFVANLYQDTFTNLQLTIGELTVHGRSDDAIAIIDRDKDDSLGQASVVVSVAAPAQFLQDIDPRFTSIHLTVRDTPFTILCLDPLLGSELLLFSTPLLGGTAFVVKNPPRVIGSDIDEQAPTSRSPVRVTTPTPNAPTPERPTDAFKHPPKLVFTADSEAASHISIRVDILSSTGPALLSQRDTRVCVQQHSPCTAMLSIGDNGQFEDIVVFPYPADVSSNPTMRVARKSGYIEVGYLKPLRYAYEFMTIPHQVVVRVASADPASQRGGYCLDRTPVVVSNGTPYAWNMNYVNLDKLAAWNRSQGQPQTLSWLPAALGSTLSDRELDLERAQDKSDPATNLKAVLKTIIRSYCLNGHQIFTLMTNANKGHIDIFIFINALRIDMPSHSVLLDACLLPLTRKNASKAWPIMQKIQEEQSARGLAGLMTTDEEHADLMKMFAACVERCRTWAHEPQCVYLAGGTPSWAAPWDGPFCECGQGKNVPDSDVMRRCKPLAHLVTRAAIGLLYAVPFLEDVGVKQFNSVKKMAPWLKNENPICAVCGVKSETLKVCSGCKTKKYCSAACQNKGWREHKKVCAKIATGVRPDFSSLSKAFGL
ncbi:hypothetical protein GGG16DRAFT_100478 [Schizophyllum commune]